MDTTTFLINYPHNGRNGITVTDQSGSPLYFFDTRKKDGCFIITDAQNQVVGSARTHKLSSKIEIEVPGSAAGKGFEIKAQSMMSGSYNWFSPAFGGQELIWKNKFLSSKIYYDLLDDKSLAIAHFESAGMKSTKVGHLELTNSVMQKDIMQEVMVTFLVMFHRKIKSIDDANMSQGIIE